MALELGIWTGRRDPAGKLRALDAMKAKGRRPLMVGDGLNDGPALAAAHASIAPGTASDASQQAADAVFIEERLTPVALDPGCSPHDGDRPSKFRLRNRIQYSRRAIGAGGVRYAPDRCDSDVVEPLVVVGNCCVSPGRRKVTYECIVISYSHRAGHGRDRACRLLPGRCAPVSSKISAAQRTASLLMTRMTLVSTLFGNDALLPALVGPLPDAADQLTLSVCGSEALVTMILVGRPGTRTGSFMSLACHAGCSRKKFDPAQ